MQMLFNKETCDIPGVLPPNKDEKDWNSSQLSRVPVVGTRTWHANPNRRSTGRQHNKKRQIYSGFVIVSENNPSHQIGESLSLKREDAAMSSPPRGFFSQGASHDPFARPTDRRPTGRPTKTPPKCVGGSSALKSRAPLLEKRMPITCARIWSRHPRNRLSPPRAGGVRNASGVFKRHGSTPERRASGVGVPLLSHARWGGAGAWQGRVLGGVLRR